MKPQLTVLMSLVLLLVEVGSVKIDLAKPSTSTPPLSGEVPVTTVAPDVDPTATTPAVANASSNLTTPAPTTTTTPSTTLLAETTTAATTTTKKPGSDVTTEKPGSPAGGNGTSFIGNPFLVFINRRADNKVQNYYCSCDLQINVCEINCCCDLDCSKEVVKLFDCAAGEVVNVQEYDYFGTLQDCKISGGLLCVTSSNVKEESKTYFDFSQVATARKSRWTPVFDVKETDERRNDFYEQGEEVMLFNEATEMLEVLTVPRGFGGSRCIFNEPVKWLEATRSSCWESSDNASAFTIDLFNKFNASRVLVYPVTPSMEYHCSPTSCANITISRCTKQCLALNSTEDLLSEVHRVEVLIWHNFTHISGVNVSFIQGNIDEERNLVEQVLTIKWKAVDERGLDSYEVSGNPGYLKEKAILVAKEVTFTNYTEENKIFVLDFFYFNNGSEPYNANRTLLLPKSRKGQCAIDSSATITFGVHVNRRCSATLSAAPNITQASNFTSICEAYQTQLLELLAPNLVTEAGNISSRIFISHLGNPRNDSRFWTNLEVKMEEAAVSGAWQPGLGAFTCSNMVISARFEFFYARLRQPGASGLQNTIKKATLLLEPRLDLQFKPDEVAVPIFVQTQFYDLTGGGGERLSGGPLILVIFSIIFVCFN